MTPLIDMDILRYEVGAYGQYTDDNGNIVAKNFEYVAEALDQKVSEICALVWATEDPICFLSMDARTKKRHARKIEKKIKRLEKQVTEVGNDKGDAVEVITKEINTLKEAQVYKPNFREEVAEKKVYKGNRSKSVKPLHYDNLTEYILANYECVMAEGLEADDLLSIYQRNAEPLTTIICSRDKDLRMVPGMQFGWECGKQAQFGPEKVDELGRLYPIYRGKTAKGAPILAELKGTGTLFFLAQLITGDTVDNIPGIPRVGVTTAYAVLKDIKNVEDGYKAVKELYVKKFGDDWRDEMLEQGRLLWMVAELDEEGKPVMWVIPECLED